MTSEEDVYCFCRQPYNENEFMIQCDSCLEWFHGACVGLDEKTGKKLKKYNCPTCEAVLDLSKNYNTRSRRNKKSKIMDYSSFEFKKEELEYWKNDNIIKSINKENCLILKKKLSQPGHIYHMNISNDGTMLATCSTIGNIRIWDIKTFELIQELSDENEKQIDEFYFVKFSKDDKFIITGGKRKNRYQWSNNDNDNSILHCPLKIFHLLSGKIHQILDGHTEEILCLKKIKFKKEEYYLTGSYDGSMIKWKINEKTNKIQKEQTIMDGISNVIFSISFLPKCENKFFLAGCDDKIKLFDFEFGELIQVFETGYGCYCDCLKFINNDFYFITKGSELEDEKSKLPLVANECHLRKLNFEDGKFSIETIQKFNHEEYKSNSYLVQILSNQKYLISPDTKGKIFIWNLENGKLSSILNDSTNEIRDVLFFGSYFLSCGDDSSILIYSQ
eukprot:gene2488-3197_t